MAALLALALSVHALQAQTNHLVIDHPSDLTKLDIDELMNLEVTSPKKQPERLFQSAAAVSVITAEDIRRSGAMNIPEALRLSPGLEVAQVDAHTWAITSRGFNNVFANKLLVLVDGRSVYTPLFSGTYWDAQDTVLEDIDRIEVIRGPGAALWGANAVNGVINITTKTARETQGWLISGGAGTEDRGFGSVRYGGKIGEKTFYRAYFKYFDRDDSVLPSGADARDDWQSARGGFRLDHEVSDTDSLTLQGDIYRNWQDQVVDAPVPASPPGAPFPTTTTIFKELDAAGGNALGRWSHRFSDTSDSKLQLYYDNTYRESAVDYTGRSLEETRETIDVDFQHRFEVGSRHELTWGLGYRNTWDKLGDNYTASFAPDSRSRSLYSAFLQDEITLIDETLHFIGGSKFEHNDWTGFEVQPNARLIWTPSDQHTLWGSVSRAVRTPSRAERDVTLRIFQPPTAALPVPSILEVGGHGFDSEELVAYELGYRLQARTNLAFDLALFYNDYDHLRTATFTSFSPVTFTTATSLQNDMVGESYGGELAAIWQPTDWWRLQASYSLLKLQLHLRNGSRDKLSEAAEGESPQNQAALRSSMNLPLNLELDGALRFVDNLSSPSQNIPSYVSLDLRLGWRATRNLEFSIVGQNLLDDRHPEFRPTIITTQTTEVQRSVYGKMTWRF